MNPVSVLEMQELDRRTIEDTGVPSIVLMENAGRCVSEAARDMLGGSSGKRAAVFCGTGNNGGDGFVAARYLRNYGADVKVYIVGEKSRIKNDPFINLKILENLGVEIKEISSAKDIEADLIIDAIFGIGLKGEVKGPAKAIIEDLNNMKRLVISVDVPSGLDADTGEILGEAIRARKTVTMQLPKKGFYINEGPKCAGEVIVADIGVIY